MTTPSRQDLRRQRRQQIEERQRREEQEGGRRRLLGRLRTWVAVGLVVLGVAIFVFWVLREVTAPLPGEPIPDEGRSHVEPGSPLAYRSNPPSSGPHYGSTARWAFYDAEVSPGFWLHNLEHGGVVLLYRCPEDCAELKRQLQGLYSTLRRSKYGNVKMVVAPDSSLEGRVTALAWNRREALDRFDEGKIRSFYEAYVDHGPEDVP